MGQTQHRTPVTRPLSLKERRFIDAYLGSARGNGTEACRLAGYRGSGKVLGIQAGRLLVKAGVRAVIATRAARQTAQAILTAEQRDARLSEIALLADHTVAVAAIRELNKCSGRHSIKHVLDVTEKLSDIIAGSRQK